MSMPRIRLLVALSLLAVFYGVCVCAASPDAQAALPTSRSGAMSTLMLTPSEKAEMEARYGTPSDALYLRGLPRWKDKNELNVNDTDYYIGLAVYAAVGVALAVIIFFFSIFFCCCHCCCHCCEPRAAGYTDKNRNWNLFFTLFFALAIAAAGIAGMVTNANGHAQFTNEQKGVLNVRSIVVNGAVGALDDIKGDIKVISDQVPPTADSAYNFVQNLNTLVSGKINTLTNKINKLQAFLNNTLEVPQYGLSFECTQCEDNARDANDIKEEVHQKAGNSLDQVAEFTDDVSELIVDAKTEIMDEINDAFAQMDDVRNDLNGYGSDFKKYEDDAKSYENIVYSVTFALMALPLLALVIVIFGTILKKESLFKCAWVFGYFMVILCWLLAGIYITVGITLGDACDYSKRYEQDPGAIVGDGRGEAIVTSCLLDTSLVTALELEEALAFTNITYPEMNGVDDAFTLPKYDNWKASLNNLNLGDFGLGPSVFTNAFNQLNAETTPDVFDRNNIDTCNPNNYGNPTLVQNKKNAVKGLLVAEAMANERIAYIRSNVTDTADYIVSLKGTYQQILTEADQLKDTIQDLLDDAQEFLRTATCGQLGVTYGTVKTALCTDTVKSFSGLGICYFVIAIVGIFFIWFSFRMGNRMQHPIVDEAEDYFVQLAKQQAAAKVPAADDENGHTGGDDDNAFNDNKPSDHVLTISDRNAEGSPNMYPALNDDGQHIEMASHNPESAHVQDEEHGNLPGQPDPELNANLEDMQRALREQQEQLEALQRQQEAEEAHARSLEQQSAPSPRRASLLPPINGAQPIEPSAPLMDQDGPVKSSSNDGFKY